MISAKHIIAPTAVFHLKDGKTSESSRSPCKSTLSRRCAASRLHPLGISYLTAVLEEKGYKVDVVDCQVNRPSQQEMEEKFRLLNPDIIGVTTATVTYFPGA